MTDLDRNSKHDTILLTFAGDLEVDVSQERTDLVDHTTYLNEAPSARAALTLPREISIIVDAKIGDTGILLNHGNAAGTSYTYRVRVNASGEVECAENGALRIKLELPNLEFANRKFLIHWSTRQQTSSTVSELLIFNYDVNQWSQTTATHTTGTTDATWDLTIGGFGAGLSGFAGGLAALHAVRIGRRFHSMPEAREDWVEERTPPATTAIRRRAALPCPRTALPFANNGEFAGPAYLWAGANTREHDRRLISPILNVRFPDPKVLRDTYLPAAWYRTSPKSSTMHLCITHLFRRPVNSRYGRVRIFVRQSTEVDPETAPVYYQMHSLRNLPTLLDPNPGALITRVTTAVSCTSNHGFGPGEWLDLGQLELVVDDDGCTWLALGHSIDHDSGTDEAFDTRARVRAIVVEPYNLPEPDNQNKKGP